MVTSFASLLLAMVALAATIVGIYIDKETTSIHPHPTDRTILLTPGEEEEEETEEKIRSVQCIARCPAVCPKLPPSRLCPSPCPSPCQSCPASSCTRCPWKVLVTYDHFQGYGYYKAYNEPRTWHEAKDTCAREGCSLAVANSEEEAEIYKSMCRWNGMHEGTWVGISDWAENDQFVTLSGQMVQWSGYNQWQPRRPNNAKNKRCVIMDKNKLYYNEDCSRLWGYICECPENIGD